MAASRRSQCHDPQTDYLTAESDPEDPPPPPPGVLFFCDWGCAIWSLLDCREPAGRMWLWEEGDRCPQELTLSDWLQAVAGWPVRDADRSA